jgi:hypothetical protein
MKTPPPSPVNASRPKPRAKRGIKAPVAVGKPPIAEGTGDADAGKDLALPHERDESIGHTAEQPDPVIVQAHKDIEAGLVDTDLRATPGLDAARRDAMVRGGRRR